MHDATRHAEHAHPAHGPASGPAGPAQAPERFLTVVTDLTTFCNLKCRFCYFSVDSDWETTRISHELFQSRFGPCADRIKTIGLSCANESLVARKSDLFRIFDFVKEQRIPESFLITNAVLLSREISEKLVETGITSLQVSLDSHVKETFEAIRVGAKFETVVENVRAFVQHRRERKASLPLLQVNCVLMRCNIEQMPEFVDFIAELGADLIDFRHVVLYEGLGLEGQSLLAHKELTNRSLAVIRAKCAEHGIGISALPEPFHIEPPPAPAPPEPERIVIAEVPPVGSPTAPPVEPPPVEPPPAESPAASGRVCTLPLAYMYVQPDGGVRPCTYWYGQEPIGRLGEVDFDTLWNQPDYVQLRDEVSHGIFKRHCCQTCPTRGSGSVDDDGSFEAKRL
jgi:radical SAM protein with 4Fe4S-binding SPASM domain